MDIMECTQQYTWKDFGISIIEGVVTSVMLAVFIGFYSVVFQKHRLNPIDIKEVSIGKTNATVYTSANGYRSVGLSVELPVRIQNLGNKLAEDIKVIINISDKLLISGGPYSYRFGQSLYPGQIGEFKHKIILNLEEYPKGSFSFDFDVFVLPKNGGITFFKIGIFNNPSHELIKNSYVKDIDKLNRFWSYLLRQHKDNKIIRDVLKKKSICKWLMDNEETFKCRKPKSIMLI